MATFIANQSSLVHAVRSPVADVVAVGFADGGVLRPVLTMARDAAVPLPAILALEEGVFSVALRASALVLLLELNRRRISNRRHVGNRASADKAFRHAVREEVSVGEEHKTWERHISAAHSTSTRG